MLIFRPSIICLINSEQTLLFAFQVYRTKKKNFLYLSGLRLSPRETKQFPLAFASRALSFKQISGPSSLSWLKLEVERASVLRATPWSLSQEALTCHRTHVFSGVSVLVCT